MIRSADPGLFPSIPMGKPAVDLDAAPFEAPEDSPEPGTAPELDADASARLRAMVQAHLPFVWRTARRLGVPEAEVDDVTQKVFWLAARRLADIPSGEERGYLFRTTLGLASNARRGQRRRREVDLPQGVPGEPRDPTPGPDDLADRKKTQALALAILDEMPDELRAVFVLFEIEELGMAEIAALMDIPKGTVASRLRRAREHAQEAIQRHDARRSFSQTAAIQDPSRSRPRDER